MKDRKWIARLMSTKPNVHAPMSPVPEKANAVNVFHITLSLKSFRPVPSPLKWKRPMTALSADLFRHSTPEVAKKTKSSSYY